MSLKVYEDVNRIILKNNNTDKNKKILIMGLTFKENCPDTRNSKVLDLFNHFKRKKFDISSFDPYSKKFGV